MKIFSTPGKIKMLMMLFCGIIAYSQTEIPKLNHLYFVTDSATFQKFKANDFNKSLFSMDAGMPDFSSDNSVASTIYIRFKNTYIELMGPKNKFGEEVGNTGFGFSFDTVAGKNYAVRDFQRDKNMSFERYDFSPEIGSKSINWYTSYFQNTESTMASWYAFYNPIYLTAAFKKSYSTYRRNDFLENIFDKKANLSDIEIVEVNCNPTDFQRLTNELKGFGALPKKKSNSEIFQLDEVRLILNKVSGLKKSRLKQIVFKNNSKKPKDTTFKYGDFNIECSKKCAMSFN